MIKSNHNPDICECCKVNLNLIEDMARVLETHSAILRVIGDIVKDLQKRNEKSAITQKLTAIAFGERNN